MKVLTEIIEGASILIVLCAYAFLNFDILLPYSVSYHALNLAGACGIVYVSQKKKIIQPLVLNIIRALIVMIGIIGLWL